MSSKLQLPTVTLICADCVDPDRAIHAMDKSTAQCDFGAVKLLTSLPTSYPQRVEIRPLRSINDYSAFCLKSLHEYCDTTHMLIVQHDGWVLNGGSWEADWINYDYIGPVFQQEDYVCPEMVGSGGFSLRSKALMAEVARVLPPWDGSASYEGCDGRNFWGHEDGVVCKHLRFHLVHRGFKFAPPDKAARFGYTRSRLEHLRHLPAFGFHGHWPELLPQGVSSELVLNAVDRMRAARAIPEIA